MELFLILLIVLVGILLFLLIKIAAMSGALGNTVRFLLGNNYRYDEAADLEVSTLLDKVENNELSAKLRCHRIVIGDKEIWVGNFPYAYGHICRKDARVSLKTFKRVRKLHLELVGK